MNLGIEQGKRVGEILNSLLDEVISGALENEHNALMQRGGGASWLNPNTPKVKESGLDIIMPSMSSALFLPVKRAVSFISCMRAC